ncbi:MAG: L,D-transpeptidase [Gemmatimonadota bacterium]
MKTTTILLAAILTLAVACSREDATRAKDKAKETATNVATKVEEAIDVAVPFGKDDPAAREKERFDEQWRGLSGFSSAQPGQPQAPAAPAINVTFAPAGMETFKGLETAEAINNAPVVVPVKGDVAGPSVLKTQVYLDRAHFSVGALDGRWGRNSAIALWWYQRSRGIEAADPGALDEQTFRSLAAAAGGVPALVQHTLGENDLKGPFVSIPDDMYDKAKLNCLCYETVQEKLAEKFHTTIDLLDRLNPGVKVADVKVGDRLWVPNVRAPLTQDQPDIAKIVVSIRGNSLNAFDAGGNLIFHAPTTLGSKYDPSPNETVAVKKTVFDPHFHYQPTLLAEVPDDEPEANLNPGPNSPVGVVWSALTKPHFGIHGTSDPDSIGYASSHGCVRLTNWDAAEVGHRVSPGVPVEFLDTREIAAGR